MSRHWSIGTRMIGWVAAIVLPKDVQDAKWEEPKARHGFTHSGPGYTRPDVIPHEADIRRAAELFPELLQGTWLVAEKARLRDATLALVEPAQRELQAERHHEVAQQCRASEQQPLAQFDAQDFVGLQQGDQF